MPLGLGAVDRPDDRVFGPKVVSRCRRRDNVALFVALLAAVALGALVAAVVDIAIRVVVLVCKTPIRLARS